MQTSVSGEIRWRLELFQRSFEFCRQGGFSYARFLALVPDRLRLAVGDRGKRVRIPVAVDPALEALVARSRPDSAFEGGALPTHKVEVLRRYVRFGQIDAELDPVSLAGWMASEADTFLAALGRVYHQSLGEVGRGEGGLEAAYLGHLVLIDVLREVADRVDAPVSGPDRLLSMVMAQSAVDAVLSSDRVDADAIPARLGFQFGATTNPFALGAEPDAIAARPVNAYRTDRTALALARRVIEPPVEVIPLNRVISTLTRRLLVDERVRTALLVDALLEMIRDCALLIVAQIYRPGQAGRLGPLLDMTASSRGLQQMIFNKRRRQVLLSWLEKSSFVPPKPKAALTRLAEGADRVAAGDPKPLGIHGKVEERAELAVRGAVAMVLDSYTAELQRDVTSLVERVPEESSEAEYVTGRCYRLSASDDPLYHLPTGGYEGVLHIDVSQLTDTISEMRGRSVAELIWRWFFGPALAQYEQLKGRGGDRIRIVSLTSAELAFRGDIVVVVHLALELKKVLEALEISARKPIDDVLGGRSQAEAEAEEEVARLNHRLTEVDGALARVRENNESVQLLLDSKALLERQLGLLSQAQRLELHGARRPNVEVGLAITYGEVVETVPVEVPQAGIESVMFSTPLREARTLNTREEWVRRQRDARLHMAQEARGDVSVEMPFLASLRYRDGDFGIYNIGCVITDRALQVLRRERSGLLEFLEASLELRTLPDELRTRFVFDRDPELFVVGRRADGSIGFLFRSLGERDDVPLWEMLDPRSPFGQLIFGGRTQAPEDEITGWPS